MSRAVRLTAQRISREGEAAIARATAVPGRTVTGTVGVFRRLLSSSFSGCATTASAAATSSSPQLETCRILSRGLSIASTRSPLSSSAGAPAPSGAGSPVDGSSAKDNPGDSGTSQAPKSGDESNTARTDGGAVNANFWTAGAAAEKGQGAAALRPKQDEDNLWVVGRILLGFDAKLDAKQEKIRQVELGVIDRYSSLILTLDSSLQAREGDDFLAWLDSQDLPSSSNESDGNGAGARAKLETFLSVAGARLNALVADKEDILFRDRGAAEVGEDKPEKETTGEVTDAATGGADAAAQEGSRLNSSSSLSEDELYQIHLTAHRAMLWKWLSLVSESLGKQHLKPGLAVGEATQAIRAAYLAGPEDRLGAFFPLYDKHGDGHLDSESIERVVDAAVDSVAAAAERCYAAAARVVLDKKARAAMPKTMKYTMMDILEVPVKRRCTFAWAEDRKQVGPDEWRVSWEQFEPSRNQHFPELESVTVNYLKEYRKRRSDWHNQRKGRKRAAVYGATLFTAVVVLDTVLSIV